MDQSRLLGDTLRMLPPIEPSSALCRRLSLVGVRDHSLGSLLSELPLAISSGLELNLNRDKGGWWSAGYADGESLEGPLNNGKTLADAVASLVLDMKQQEWI